MKSYIELINHASILLSNQNYAILTDPWYSGNAFDDGWSLLYKNKKKKIIDILKKTTHIWISHEHPDHFSIKFINEYYNFIKDKIFLFQSTRDKRVKNFLNLRKLKIIEIEDGEKFKIDKNFYIQVQKYDFYDSALIINLDSKRVVNLNDCPLKSSKDLSKFKKKYGECDILLSQFSYAAWKGGKKKIKWRKNAAKEKIETLKLQAKFLNSKITLPFASFVYFSNYFNSYLNDSVNMPLKVIEEFKNEKTQLVYLKPYQKLYLNNDLNIKDNSSFWQKKFEKISYKKIKLIKKKNSFYELKENFFKYYQRLAENNSVLIMKTLKYIPFLNILKPIIVKLTDININIYVDLTNKIFMKTTQKADIVMHSKSLNLIFLQDYGFDTLTVNGCFEELKKNSFIKFSKCFSIGSLNNLGLSISSKIIFNLDVIFLFLSKLSNIKKKMSNNF